MDRLLEHAERFLAADRLARRAHHLRRTRFMCTDPAVKDERVCDGVRQYEVMCRHGADGRTHQERVGGRHHLPETWCPACRANYRAYEVHKWAKADRLRALRALRRRYDRELASESKS